MRRTLQILLAMIAAILCVRFAFPGVILGGAYVAPGAAGRVPLLDSEVRFLFALALAPAALLVWLIPQVERQLTVVRIIAIVTVLGGLARLLSVVRVGLPDSRALIAMGI